VAYQASCPYNATEQYTCDAVRLQLVADLDLNVISFILLLETYCAAGFAILYAARNLPIIFNTVGGRGTRSCSWFRHCATAGMSRIRFSIVSLGFFIDINFPASTMALRSTQILIEMSTRNTSWRVKAAGAEADKLTAFVCRLSRNLGASTSWNSQGISRPVQGLLYLTVIGLYVVWYTCRGKGTSQKK
jgi:hypothetical protein